MADEELEKNEEDNDDAEARREVGSRKVDASALHTVSARRDLRAQLAADVEAFLSRGGAIESVPIDYRADPPKKPESNYGRGSI